MAKLIVSVGYDGAVVTISELSGIAKLYNYFEITGDINHTWTDSENETFSTTTLVPNLRSGQTYTIYGWAWKEYATPPYELTDAYTFKTLIVGTPYSLSTEVNGLNITARYTTSEYTTHVEIERMYGATTFSCEGNKTYRYNFSSTTYGAQEHWRIRAKRGLDGEWSQWSAYQYYTTGPPPLQPPGIPSAPVSATRIDGGFNLSWGSSSGADYYVLSYWTLNDAKDTIDSIQQINVYGTSKTLTGLVYGDTYHFAVMAANDAGYSSWTAETMAAVAPKIPTLSSSNITSTSVRITASGMTGKWAYIEVYQYNSGGTYMATGYIFYSQANYIDFTNLTAGSTYTFKAKAFVQSDSGGYVESLTYSSSISVTASSYQRPTNWSWTTAELNAFNNNGAVTTLTYTRWNSFIDKVQEFIIYYNTKYGTGVPSVTQYKMSSSNKTLTATAFNNIRFSIGSMNPTGISNVSTGDIVYGLFFIILSEKLNGIS